MMGPTLLHDQIRRWLNAPSERPLCVTGPPGAGKTYTVSMLIAEAKYEPSETIDGARGASILGEGRVAVIDQPDKATLKQALNHLMPPFPRTIFILDAIEEIPWRKRKQFVHIHIPLPTIDERLEYAEDLTRRLGLDIDDEAMVAIAESAKSWRGVENEIRTSSRAGAAAHTHARTARPSHAHTRTPREALPPIEDNNTVQQVLESLEWNHAPVEQVSTAQEMQSQVWRTDYLGRISTAFLRTVRGIRHDKVPWRKRR